MGTHIRQGRVAACRSPAEVWWSSRRVKWTSALTGGTLVLATWIAFGEKEAKEMPGNVYKFLELVGTSDESWEKAAATAVEMAAKSVRNLRVAEVVELDMQLDDGKITAYRAKVKVSFKIEKGV
jgi:flavin-binding protein dodecin